jgi:hypothetical protein
MKWKEQVRLGINLGFSPQHAKSVHLVLSLTTGCVSPQFHCTFDTTFETLKDYNAPESLWQEKAHFVVNNNKLYEQKERSNSKLNNDAESENRVANTDDMRNQSQNDEEIDPTLTTQNEIEPPLQQETAQREESEREESRVRRSGRIRKPPRRFDDYIMGNQARCDKASGNSTYIEGEVINPPILQEAIAHKSVTDPDMLYLWQAR